MATAKIELVKESPEETAIREARFLERKTNLVSRAEANAEKAALLAANAEVRETILKRRGEAAGWHLEQDGRVIAYGDNTEMDGGLVLLDGAVVVGTLLAGKMLTLRTGSK